MKHLADGIEIIGKTKDSGYAHPRYLVRTKEKRFIQLTELLYNTVIALRDQHDLQSVAAKLTDLQKQEIDAGAVTFLIERHLEPLGIVKDTHVIFEARKKNNLLHPPDLLLGLKYRITLIPESVVSFLAICFKPLFWPPIMLTALLAVLGVNIWLFFFHHISQAVTQTVTAPFTFLLMIGLILLSTLFHEFGHATACSYGGGKPGKIGVGLYLVWPAFFTDLTDVYRLDKIGKLRSDIGGVYFNIIFALATTIAYFFTHFQPLLLVILFQNITVLYQLLPFLRLDGYFIISDIVGIPDLFLRMGPLLKSFLPGKRYNATQDLKPWARWTVTLWVILTIPMLVYFVATALINAPHIFTMAWVSASGQLALMKASALHNDYLTTAISALQLIILLFPALGLSYLLFYLSKTALSQMRHT